MTKASTPQHNHPKWVYTYYQNFNIHNAKTDKTKHTTKIPMIIITNFNTLFSVDRKVENI